MGIDHADYLSDVYPLCLLYSLYIHDACCSIFVHRRRLLEIGNGFGDKLWFVVVEIMRRFVDILWLKIRSDSSNVTLFG